MYLGLWEGFLGVKIARIPYHLVQRKHISSSSSDGTWYDLLEWSSGLPGGTARLAAASASTEAAYFIIVTDISICFTMPTHAYLENEEGQPYDKLRV